jgi:DNA-directed RNA polymerase subunit H (RpoH/RPB5)
MKLYYIRMSLVNKIYKSRSVILDMLELRNCNVEENKNYSINEIDIMVRNTSIKPGSELEALDLMLEKENGSKVYLKYMLNSKLRMQAISSVIRDIVPSFDTEMEDVLDLEDMGDPGLLKKGDELIIIMKDKMSNSDVLEEYLSRFYMKTNIFIQVFCLDSLQVKIIEHEYVPQHRIIDEDEKNMLLSSYNITSFNQLPIIMVNDPVAKFIGMRKGDICEISRPSETSGQYIAYRYCQ